MLRSVGQLKKLVFGLTAALLVCLLLLVVAEIAVRRSPRLLPRWYRMTLPVHGIELDRPGILAQTPVRGVPIPYQPAGTFSAAAPRDLQMLGLVAREENPDHARYPAIRLQLDALGLPNEATVESTDIVLVGDSFAVAAGISSPPGLQAALGQVTGMTVYNLGVPSIGTVREAYLLREIGLDLDPTAVIWLFFGGNDVEDVTRLLGHIEHGARAQADLFPAGVLPRCLVVDLLRKRARGLHFERPMIEGQQLPPLRFTASAGEARLWFHPRHIRNLRKSRADWEAEPGWPEIERLLDATSAELARRAIRMLLVYVPTKAQVYLRYVEGDAELLHRMASFGLAAPLADSAERLWDSSVSGTDTLDQALAALARRQRIDYISLTPYLTEAAAAGALGYLQADTHWNEIGQGTAVEPLARWLLGDGLPSSPSGSRSPADTRPLSE